MMKPMLAAGDKDIGKVLRSLIYPLLASPKFDGIRGFNHEGTIYSRSLKPLPNAALQERYRQYEDFDGEFITTSPTDPHVFRKTTSVVMSSDKSMDDTVFWAFDWRGEPDMPYYRRVEKLYGDSRVIAVPQYEVVNEYDLLNLEAGLVDSGYEGLILRNPMGIYKDGRSTLNEGLLVKIKRFADDEAVVIGFEEKMHNANEKTLIKNGKPARSSHQSGLVPLGTLGALIVRWRGLEFRLPGFDDETAQRVWDNREAYLGAHAKFKYFPVGMKDLPRHPSFLGFRDPKDMS